MVILFVLLIYSMIYYVATFLVPRYSFGPRFYIAWASFPWGKKWNSSIHRITQKAKKINNINSPNSLRNGLQSSKIRSRGWLQKNSTQKHKGTWNLERNHNSTNGFLLIEKLPQWFFNTSENFIVPSPKDLT